MGNEFARVYLHCYDSLSCSLLHICREAEIEEKVHVRYIARFEKDFFFGNDLILIHISGQKTCNSRAV